MKRSHPINSCAGGYGKCLDVKVTNQCNARCAFCIERDGYCPTAGDVSELNNATKETEADNILILGGEPLLYPNLEQYVQAIRRKNEEIEHMSIQKKQAALEYLTDAVDRIDNAAWEAIKAVTHSPADLEWDMSIIGEVCDQIEETLKAHGIPTCYPFHLDEETICYASCDRCAHCTR